MTECRERGAHSPYVTINRHGRIGDCRSVEGGWLCRHIVACRTCGMVLLDRLGAMCPDVPESNRPRLVYEEQTRHIQRDNPGRWLSWPDLPVQAKQRWRERSARLLLALPSREA